MKASDVCDGCMVEFGDKGLGATVGEVFTDEGKEQVMVWPADTGVPGIGPDKRPMILSELRPADMDRWLYMTQTNTWVPKKPGVLVAESE